MKRTGVILAVLMVILTLYGCKEPLESYNKGLTAYEEGRYSDAVSSYLLAISQGQDDGKIQADLALAYLRCGETEAAEAALEQAFSLSPEDPDVLKKVGIYCHLSGDMKQALEYYQRSVTSDIHDMSQRDLETCAYVASIEMEYQCYEEALRLYNILIEAVYYPAEHELLAGECYLGLNQIDAACQYFDMLEDRPETSPVYYLRIYKDLYAAGAYTKAEQYFEIGLLLTDAENSPISKAAYYADAEKYETAMELFKTEETVQGQLAYARTLQESSRYEEAEEVFVKLLQNGNDTAEVYNQYLMLKIRKGEYTEAFQLLTRIKAFKDEDVLKDALFNEVVLLEDTKDYEAAYERLTAYMKKYESTPAVDREYRFLKRSRSN